MCDPTNDLGLGLCVNDQRSTVSLLFVVYVNHSRLFLVHTTKIMESSTPSPSEKPLAPSNIPDEDGSNFEWTPRTVTQTLLLFLVTGIFEIGGGWLVWQAVRESKPWWYAVLGSAVLVGYGFWPTLQHTGEADSFGRIYAVYGGFFVVGSFLAGWMLDGDRPDKGDWIGGSITLAGVLVILFWPRNDGTNE